MLSLCEKVDLNGSTVTENLVDDIRRDVAEVIFSDSRSSFLLNIYVVSTGCYIEIFKESFECSLRVVPTQ